VVERADVNVAGVEQQRRQNLAEQFDHWAQAPAVVYQAHKGDTRSADEDAPELVKIATLSQDKRNDDDGQIDRHTSHTGNWAAVDLARCGLVHHTYSWSQQAGHRSSPDS